ncbi:hypothetical protein M406DRAFT_74006 [Cryphonectria parasitica EP155]|uniref:Uncharacterized protein n=1 Tax=Cryphonectria parasitica (strain ATCC 38755 / EP155) TaxID=660469 RepID=A0A9P4XY17_CRYP1|nr:uncharacterized protein M406DRAFT_74006 [Cryphonectria parasitica EP155]KAF3763389.1 hypothetical protein M406DRAFT_74006 [Cryphonectria parasitica EP155]
MASHHESWFRYPLERPYPFRWFTPLFTGMAVVAAVFFTFMNIAADGYTQKVVYTTDPNSTLHQHHWYMDAPWSWISTAQFSCQSPGISIGSPYYTSNQETASYTVTSMNTTLMPDEAAVYAGLTAQSLGITTYMNNTLRDCSMGHMQVIFTSGQEPSSAVLQIQTGPVYCYIETDQRVNITVQQSFSGTEFLFEQRSSLSQYLVYNFMKQSYTVLLDAIQAMNSTAGYTGTTLAHNLTRLLSKALQTSDISDITSDDFFTVSILSPGASESLVSSSNNNTDTPFPLAQGEPRDVSMLLDAFAKSYYSAVMWDLAFDDSNAFLNETATQYLQAAINDASGSEAISNGNLSILGSSELQGTPAQFSVQYICSVPRQKDTGSMIVSVMVSDIVLISAFWKIFDWIARRYLRSRDPNWNICPGCLERNFNCGVASQNNNNASMRVWQLDQDPLCQNVDADQHTLYNSSNNNQSQSTNPDPYWNKAGGTESVKTRESQSTIRTLDEKFINLEKITSGQYLAVS